jgi:hypothetical protein
MSVVKQISASVDLILQENYPKERILREKACMMLILKGKEANMHNRLESMNTQITTSCEASHQCRECHQYFNARNDLFKCLRNECYPDEIREQISKLTIHINDDKQQKQNLNVIFMQKWMLVLLCEDTHLLWRKRMLAVKYNYSYFYSFFLSLFYFVEIYTRASVCL